MPKISKRIVDAADPDPDRRYIIWDTQMNGFGLMVLPSGVKSYVYQFRKPDGGTRRKTIGKHGNFTPDEARHKAEAMRRDVANGLDPVAEHQRKRNGATVCDLLAGYTASAKFAEKADSTRAIDIGRINRHLRPLLGRRRLDSLREEDVRRTFAAIRDGKTATTEKTGKRGLARVTGGEGTARMAIRLLQAAMKWGVSEGVVANNPAASVKAGNDGRRDTILEDTDAYGRLFKALDQMEAERRIRQPVADAIRVIALTGARRGEVAGMQWRHVDIKAGLVTLAAHKTAKSTGKPRVIGLPAAAAVLIARQPGGGPDDYVFKAARGAGPLNLSKPWRAIRAEAELPDGIGLHGLRHSLASHMANLATSQKYIHWAGDARQAIAEKGAAVALAGLAGAASGRVADVVPIKGER
jgi:integrase